MDDQQRAHNGQNVRRDVLGPAHVDRAQQNTTDFTADFQDFITRYAWGEVWSRPGLPRQTRSLITLAMMIALNRSEEFQLHIRAAARNGVSRDEVRELLLQSAIYCGVPAANHAFKLASEIYTEMDAEPQLT